jgi:hypothetical protein
MVRLPLLAMVLTLAVAGTHMPVVAQTPAEGPAVVTPKLNLTMQQRHTIKEFIKDLNTKSAATDAAPEIGDAIPQDVSVQPMPGEVGQKVPQVKTHTFFVADGRIFIVDPKDNKVADIIKIAGD